MQGHAWFFLRFFVRGILVISNVVMIKALIGLGNKGKEYARTYHNVGVFVAQKIANYAHAEDSRSFFVYEPESFMNESGIPVQAWMRKKGLALDEVAVVHDEGDLLIGSFKMVEGGGSAGHNGIKSLVEQLGTDAFLRIRVGIRDPHEQVRRKTGTFVLSQWSAEDERHFDAVARHAWEMLKKRAG